MVVREGRLRFVEVKARHDDARDPLESITPAKQRKLIGAARAWLRGQADTYADMAFLVAIVDLSTDPWSVAWYDDAFDAG